MSDDRRIPVTDKRRTSPAGDRPEASPAGASDPAGSPPRPSPEAEASSESRPPGTASSPATVTAGTEDAERGHDYLADLQRLQAEFDNYRKRTLKEQTAIVRRASERLVERLLPVLDNLENAIAHGEGGAGVELTHKELIKALSDEGLEEIAAEGRPFDPQVHDAFDIVETDDVTESTVRRVLRKGYRLKDRVLRPVMVAVARPVEGEARAVDGDNEPDVEGSEE